MPDSPVTLIGASFGGLLSVYCALERPRAVCALVLVGPIISGLPLSEHFATRGGRARPGPDSPDEEHIAYWTEIDPWFVAPANISARAQLRALLTANPQNLRPPVELERYPEYPALPRLGEITAPTLIIVGEQDAPDVHAHCGAIQAAIPNARRVVLTGSGHVPHLEVPEEFNRTVLEFLATAAFGRCI
jgi:pimeloyl-ACP methyl ester carboxylesterase